MSDQKESEDVSVPVPSQDPEKKEEAKEAVIPNGIKADKDSDKKKEEELSEQDAQLKAELEMLVERLKVTLQIRFLAYEKPEKVMFQEEDTELYRPALESLRALIRTSTSSMTSVPKPLKFLRPHYAELQKIYDQFPTKSQDAATQNLFADILSVLAMTYSDTGKRDTLHYRLRTAGKRDDEDPGSWGHEYVRHLAAELGEEFNARQDAYIADSDIADSFQLPKELLDLALKLVPFFLSHNAEPDAVDLLLELESIESIIPFVDENTYGRVCSYMVACVDLLVPPDDRRFLQAARTIYRKQDRLTESITLAMRIGDMDAIVEDFQTPTNMLVSFFNTFHQYHF